LHSSIAFAKSPLHFVLHHVLQSLQHLHSCCS
jgi:hypothetical protein